MQKTTSNEELIYHAVELGELVIEKDGTIWRVGRRTNGPRVFSVERKRAEYINSKGYLVVAIDINGKRLSTGAHRLVWYHFFGTIPEGHTINHIDGRKQFNAPSNLEIATDQEQRRHALDVLKCAVAKGERHGMAKLTEGDVLEIRWRHAKGEKKADLARAFNVSKANVGDICSGKLWSEIGGPTSPSQPKTKLTEDAVREIRRRVEAGEKQSNLAEEFGVGRPVVSQIISRQLWAHVE